MGERFDLDNSTDKGRFVKSLVFVATRVFRKGDRSRNVLLRFQKYAKLIQQQTSHVILSK